MSDDDRDDLPPLRLRPRRRLLPEIESVLQPSLRRGRRRRGSAAEQRVDPSNVHLVPTESQPDTVPSHVEPPAEAADLEFAPVAVPGFGRQLPLPEVVEPETLAEDVSDDEEATPAEDPSGQESAGSDGPVVPPLPTEAEAPRPSRRQRRRERKARKAGQEPAVGGVGGPPTAAPASPDLSAVDEPAAAVATAIPDQPRPAIPVLPPADEAEFDADAARDSPRSDHGVDAIQAAAGDTDAESADGAADVEFGSSEPAAAESPDAVEESVAGQAEIADVGTDPPPFGDEAARLTRRERRRERKRQRVAAVDTVSALVPGAGQAAPSDAAGGVSTTAAPAAESAPDSPGAQSDVAADADAADPEPEQATETRLSRRQRRRARRRDRTQPSTAAAGSETVPADDTESAPGAVGETARSRDFPVPPPAPEPGADPPAEPAADSATQDDAVPAEPASPVEESQPTVSRRQRRRDRRRERTAGSTAESVAASDTAVPEVIPEPEAAPQAKPTVGEDLTPYPESAAAEPRLRRRQRRRANRTPAVGPVSSGEAPPASIPADAPVATLTRRQRRRQRDSGSVPEVALPTEAAVGSTEAPAVQPASGAAGPRDRKAPLYWRLLRLRHVHPNGWQRALLLEGVIAAAVVLVLAGVASIWTLLVLPVVVALLVKLHDLLAGSLASPARVDADDPDPGVGAAAVERGSDESDSGAADSGELAGRS
jgi:hypothetical protein